MKVRERRRIKKTVQKLDHAASMKMLRSIVFGGSDDEELKLMLAERAVATDPDCPGAQRYHDALAHGRRVGVLTGKIISVDGVTEATVREIDEVFE